MVRKARCLMENEIKQTDSKKENMYILGFLDLGRAPPLPALAVVCNKLLELH